MPLSKKTSSSDSSVKKVALCAKSDRGSGAKARWSGNIFSFESGTCFLIAIGAGCVAAARCETRTHNVAGSTSECGWQTILDEARAVGR